MLLKYFPRILMPKSNRHSNIPTARHVNKIGILLILRELKDFEREHLRLLNHFFATLSTEPEFTMSTTAVLNLFFHVNCFLIDIPIPSSAMPARITC